MVVCKLLATQKEMYLPCRAGLRGVEMGARGRHHMSALGGEQKALTAPKKG